LDIIGYYYLKINLQWVDLWVLVVLVVRVVDVDVQVLLYLMMMVMLQQLQQLLLLVLLGGLAWLQARSPVLGVVGGVVRPWRWRRRRTTHQPGQRGHQPLHHPHTAARMRKRIVTARLGV